MTEFLITKVFPDKRTDCVWLVGQVVSGSLSIAGKKLCFDDRRKFSIGPVSEDIVLVEGRPNLSTINIKFETSHEREEILQYFNPGKRILFDII